MNKKFGVEIVAFNNVDFLEAIIRLFQPFVNKIVVSTSDKSWNGNVKNNQKVKRIVSRLMNTLDNVYLVESNWKTETEQRNETLQYLSECDYIFIVDADEAWSSGDIHNMKEFALQHPGYTVFRCSWNTRFKNINWRVEPREPFKPIVLIGRNIKFSSNREVIPSPNAMAILVPEKFVVVEHFSYIRSNDLDIKEKIKTFSHANEIINGIDWWYENIYLQADLDSKNLHPTDLACYANLIKDDIHPEIKEFLKKYSPQLF